MNIRTLAPALALVFAACTAQDQTPDTAATTGTMPVASATTATMAAETTTPAASTGAQMDTFSMPAPASLLTTPSGLQYTIDRPGTGPQPQPGQTVTVHYSGWLTDGTPFDSSRDRGTPFEFPIGARRVIKGWDEGVMAMKVGEVRTLVIPASLGYGPGGRGAIPPNATLVFKVELLGTR